jgi:DHA2 family lincomycin resistance protein-like MFS transporter
VRGLDTVQAGLILLPGGLFMGLMGPFVGRLFDRFGPRVLTIPGSLLVVGVLFGFSRISAATPVPALLALHITMMIGLSLTFTPIFTSGLNSLPRRLYPHGSALVGTLQQVAGAAGTALLVTVMAMTQGRALLEGASDVLALQTGIQTAMGVAAVMAIAGVILVVFIGRDRSAGVDDRQVAAEPEIIYEIPRGSADGAGQTDHDPEAAVAGQLR